MIPSRLTWHFFYETKVRGISENISLQYKFTKLKLTLYNNTHIYKNPSSIQIAKESDRGTYPIIHQLI